MGSLQATIDRVRFGHASGAELLALLRSHPSPLVRANVAMRLPEAADLPPDAVAAALEDAARDPAHGFRLMGTITVGHLAVAALFRVCGTRAAEVVRRWPEPDRADLLWHLRAEGIDAEPAAAADRGRT